MRLEGGRSPPLSAGRGFWTPPPGFPCIPVQLKCVSNICAKKLICHLPFCASCTELWCFAFFSAFGRVLSKKVHCHSDYSARCLLQCHHIRSRQSWFPRQLEICRLLLRLQFVAAHTSNALDHEHKRKSPIITSFLMEPVSYDDTKACLKKHEKNQISRESKRPWSPVKEGVGLDPLPFGGGAGQRWGRDQPPATHLQTKGPPIQGIS